MNKIIKMTGNNNDEIYFNVDNVTFLRPANVEGSATSIHFISGEACTIALKPNTIYRYIESLNKPKGVL